MHSVAMSAAARNARESPLTMVQSPAMTHPRPAPFVRLVQLRKLRKCEQVAAVCYRVHRGDIEFLLIRTRGSGRWTFPKGSTEPGLTHSQAAALEAFEEAGVHGRIEEASFTRYFRRKRAGARNSARRSGERGIAVNAHLCEVLRLAPAQEAKRNRTWFSVEDARRRLREGRKTEEGNQFVRVVERAVTRIGLQSETDAALKSRPQNGAPQNSAPQKDPLQKVKFDFAEAYGRAGAAPFASYTRQQLAGMRRVAVPIVGAHRREILQGEVLQFGAKKARALGTGAKQG